MNIRELKVFDSVMVDGDIETVVVIDGRNNEVTLDGWALPVPIEKIEPIIFIKSQ